MRRNFHDSMATKGQPFSYFMSDPVLAAGATMLVQVISGDGSTPSFRASLDIDRAGTLEFFDNGTLVTAGTPANPTARDTDQDPTALMRIRESPVVSGFTGPLDFAVTAGGTAKTETWILEEGKRYFLRATNVSALSANAVLRIDFSE